MKDQLIRADNVKRGRELCKRCNGTGNQLMSMWQRCEDCGGSGRKDYELKKPRLKLSPELADGDSWTPVSSFPQMVEAIKAWHGEFGEDDGEAFSVEVIMMSDHEIDDLPEL